MSNPKTLKEKMNKKGQIFTIIAILLISLMFVSFEIYSYVQQRQAIKTRVSTMDSFLNSLETNLERQLYISGFRILFLAGDYIATSGNYISDLDSLFKEGFFNGTIGGISNSILDGATYYNITNAINTKASKISVVVNISDTNISVSQEDPWNVKFTMITNFLMRDKQDLARWNKTQNISVLISVVGFEDPIYTHEVGGGFSRKINQTIYEGNYVSCPTVTNLRDHVDKGYYSANTNAPSFLNRLEGNFSADINGIESFVKSSDVPFIQDKSLIDYIYFSTNNPTHSSLAGMQSWFEIDDAHKPRYSITC